MGARRPESPTVHAQARRRLSVEPQRPPGPAEADLREVYYFAPAPRSALLVEKVPGVRIAAPDVAAVDRPRALPFPGG